MPTRQAATKATLSRPYPQARRSDARVIFHGVSVPDPYQWMEDGNNPETQAWVDAQHKITDEFLNSGSVRDNLYKELEAMWREDFGAFATVSGNRLFQYIQGEGEHPTLVVRDGLEGEPRILLDADELQGNRQLAPDPQTLVPSPSGRYVCCAFGPAGDDLNSIHIIDTDSGRILDDEIEANLLNAVAWHPDESGFYYCRLRGVYRMQGRQEEETGLYWHPLGGSKADEKLVYRCPWNNGWLPTPTVDEKNGLLWVNHVNIVTGNNGFAWSQLGDDLNFHELIAADKGWADFIYCDGREAYFATNIGAERGHIVAWDLNAKPGDTPRILVPQSDNVISPWLKSARFNSIVSGSELLVTYMEDGQHRIRRFDLNGKPMGEIKMPCAVTVSGLASWKEGQKIIVNAQSFVLPPSLFLCDLETGETVSLFGNQAILPLNDIQTHTEFYTSTDGVRVPLTLLTAEGTAPGQPRPTLLSAYGGLGYSLTPKFGVDIGVWVKSGGVYAVAHIRGGGEYGEAWHNAGRYERRQQVHDDFHAAANYLTKTGWTNNGLLAIRGASLGGFLVTACRNERPELYGAVVAIVPLIDLLSSMASKSAGVSGNDLGLPDKDLETFKRQLKMSPLHNLGNGTDRPPLLAMPGELDNRVLPELVYKYIAQAQYVAEPKEIALLKVMQGAGHAGLSRTDKIKLYADYLSFVTLALDI